MQFMQEVLHIFSSRLNLDMTLPIPNLSTSRGIVLSLISELSTNIECLRSDKEEHRSLEAPGHLKTPEDSHQMPQGLCPLRH